MSHTKTPWFPITHQDCHVSIMRSHRGGTWTCIEGEHAGDPIVGVTLTDYLHSVHCVNSHDELVRQRDELLETLNAVLNVSSAYIPSDAVYEFESGLVVNVKNIIEKAKTKCKGGKK